MVRALLVCQNAARMLQKLALNHLKHLNDPLIRVEMCFNVSDCVFQSLLM